MRQALWQAQTSQVRHFVYVFLHAGIHYFVAVKNARSKRRIEYEEDFFQPTNKDFFEGETSIADKKTEFLTSLRNFQWSHGLSERTMKDMLEEMKKGEIRNYIQSGQEMPHMLTEADRRLQAEVSAGYLHAHTHNISYLHIIFYANQLCVGWCRSSDFAWMSKM